MWCGDATRASPGSWDTNEDISGGVKDTAGDTNMVWRCHWGIIRVWGHCIGCHHGLGTSKWGGDATRASPGAGDTLWGVTRGWGHPM